jgi:phosphatidylinositol alpha-1,6-mannosyltransferase
MKLIFISHSYPPILGGVENQNRDLSRGLTEITKTKIIANGKGKYWLPVFVPWAFLKTFFLLMRYDAVLLGSGVLAPLGRVLKFFHPRKKFFCVIHGLDITYAQKKGFLPRIYRWVNIPALKKMDRLFAVGNATISEAKKAGLTKDNKDRCVFIPNGVNTQNFIKKHTRKELTQLLGKNTEDKVVILRLARFVPHKGTSWFIREVMPHLGPNVLFVATGHRVDKNTAGDQDDFLNCEKAILEKGLEDRVVLLPSLPQEDLLVLLNTVDIMVSPNIKVPGSMEGFGINAIEAGACGRVLVASDLEGLADAVKNGENGILVEPENTQQWVRKIQAVIEAKEEFRERFGKRAQKYVQKHFSWPTICRRYLGEMRKVNGRRGVKKEKVLK